LDIYQYVIFAGQYRLDIKKFLQSIVASRMFTKYQLVNTIIYDLPKLIIQYLQQQHEQQNFEPKVIVISDLLEITVIAVIYFFFLSLLPPSESLSSSSESASDWDFSKPQKIQHNDC
jgi:hypothetical protein